jgi:hypothetical protein
MMTSDGDRSSRKRAWYAGMAALGALAIGCATMTEAAQKKFAADHAGCPATVRPRPDLKWGDNDNAIEVTGCNSDVLYSCAPYHLEPNPDGTSSSPVSAACSTTNWCTPDGCDSFELAARNTLVRDKTCPLERVTAKPHGPQIPAPPADIGADPERMRMWVQSHQQAIAGHTFMTASGCGAEVLYECVKPAYGVRAIPICGPAAAQ